MPSLGLAHGSKAALPTAVAGSPVSHQDLSPEDAGCGLQLASAAVGDPVAAAHGAVDPRTRVLAHTLCFPVLHGTHCPELALHPDARGRGLVSDRGSGGGHCTSSCPWVRLEDTRGAAEREGRTDRRRTQRRRPVDRAAPPSAGPTKPSSAQRGPRETACRLLTPQGQQSPLTEKSPAKTQEEGTGWRWRDDGGRPTWDQPAPGATPPRCSPHGPWCLGGMARCCWHSACWRQQSLSYVCPSLAHTGL